MGAGPRNPSNPPYMVAYVHTALSGHRHRTQNTPGAHTGEQAPSDHVNCTRNTPGAHTGEQVPSGHGHRTHTQEGELVEEDHSGDLELDGLAKAEDYEEAAEGDAAEAAGEWGDVGAGGQD